MGSGDFFKLISSYLHDHHFNHWAFSPALLKIFICGCFILAVLNWAQACSVLGIDLTTNCTLVPGVLEFQAQLHCTVLSCLFVFFFPLWLWECDCSLHVLSPSELWDHNFWGLTVEIYLCTITAGKVRVQGTLVQFKACAVWVGGEGEPSWNSLLRASWPCASWKHSLCWLAGTTGLWGLTHPLHNCPICPAELRPLIFLF